MNDVQLIIGDAASWVIACSGLQFRCMVASRDTACYQCLSLSSSGKRSGVV